MKCKETVYDNHVIVVSYVLQLHNHKAWGYINVLL